MPVRTELEWAKEICKRQGYYVIQQSRVQELYARTMIADYEWDVMREDTKFRTSIWRKLMYQIADELVGRNDFILRDERDLEQENLRLPVLQPIPLDDPSRPLFKEDRRPFNGHVFQSRITVIKYG